MPIPDGFARRLLPVLRDLVAEYGTPFHIYDAAGIVDTHRGMVNAFRGEPFRQSRRCPTRRSWRCWSVRAAGSTAPR